MNWLQKLSYYGQIRLLKFAWDVSMIDELTTHIPYKMKYWREMYLGRMADFSATANIKSALI